MAYWGRIASILWYSVSEVQAKRNDDQSENEIDHSFILLQNSSDKEAAWEAGRAKWR